MPRDLRPARCPLRRTMRGALLAAHACALVYGAWPMLPALASEDCFDYATSLHWTARVPIRFPTSVAVNGDFAFVGADSSLIGVDLGDIGAPRIVSETPLKTPVGEMVWRDDLLYVPGDGAGFAIFDVSIPAAPVLMSWLDTPGAAFGVALSGDHAFVADFSAGVQVIDVSDPAAPAIVTTVATPGFAYDVTLAGPHLLVGHGHGLLVVDVSDPLSPAVVGNLPTKDRVVGIDAVGPLVAAAADSSGLLLVDLSVPAQPRLLSQLWLLESVIEVTIHGDRAFLSCPWYGLEVVDVADPMHPVLSFTVGQTGKPAMSLIAGDLLYVPDFNYGLEVFRLGPWFPPDIGTSPLEHAAQALAVDGSLAYLPTGSGPQGWLEIYDVGSGGAPALLGTVATLPFPQAVVAAGGLAYVGGATGIQVFDVSDPRNPAARSTLALPGGADALVLGPPGLLLALNWGEWNSTFYTVGVADPAAPAILGSLLLAWSLEDMDYGLGRAYVHGAPGILVVDVTRPEAPVLTGERSVRALDMELALPAAGGGRAPLAYLIGIGELAVADLSDPDAPVVIGSVNGPFADRLARQGRHLYASGRGLSVYDLAIPDRPALIGGSAAEAGRSLLAIRAATGQLIQAGRAGGFASPYGLAVLPGQCDAPGPIELTMRAAQVAGGIEITWFPGGHDLVAVRILRAPSPAADQVPLTPDWLAASGPGRFVDRSAEPGIPYFYWLATLDRAGSVSTFGPVSAAAGAPALALSLRPNPCGARDRVEVDFALPVRCKVHLDVIDTAGRWVKRLVADELDAGPHGVAWDGTNDRNLVVASGRYVLRLNAGGRVETASLVRLR